MFNVEMSLDQSNERFYFILFLFLNFEMQPMWSASFEPL